MATHTSSKKASSTNDRKGKTDDATKSSVLPGAIEYNPNDDDDDAPNQQDVTVSLSPLETLVEGVKRFSRCILEGSPEQLRNVTSKKPVGVTRDSLSVNQLTQKLDDIQEESSPGVAADTE